MSAERNVMIAGTGRETRPEEVKVWDPLVRNFHWSLAGLVLFAFISGEDWGRSIHVNAGYAVLALIGFRIVWGFIGTKHARFPTLSTALRQSRGTFSISCASGLNGASGITRSAV